MYRCNEETVHTNVFHQFEHKKNEKFQNNGKYILCCRRVCVCACFCMREAFLLIGWMCVVQTQVKSSLIDNSKNKNRTRAKIDMNHIEHNLKHSCLQFVYLCVCVEYDSCNSK